MEESKIYLQGLLQENGMSEYHASIYLCLWELGSAPASVVARRLGIHRLTMYAHLNEFVTLGYGQKFEKNKVAHFSVVDPEQLLQQKQHVCERLERALPLFAQFQHSRAQKPKMSYYEGLEAVKSLYDRILQEATTQEIVGFISSESLDPQLEKFLYEVHVPERIKRSIYAKILVPHTPSNQKYASLDTKLFKETRYIKEHFMDTTCEINLFGEDKVAIILYKTDEMCAVYFSNIHLYKVLYGFFSYLWELGCEE